MESAREMSALAIINLVADFVSADNRLPTVLYFVKMLERIMRSIF